MFPVIEDLPLINSQVTEEAVQWAYRMILGREPENSDVVNDHLQQLDSLAALRQRFLDSAEFLESRSAASRDKAAGMEPPCLIKSGADEDTTNKLVKHIADSWNELGKTEPYWSVLSQPDFKMERIGETKDEFLESGRFQVERLFATLRRCGIEPISEWDVFELGCGLGRITRWLAEEFRDVLACDISASHLSLAKQINADAAKFTQIQWRQLKSPNEIAGLPPFDLFFSVIVLQHNPPPVIAMLLDQIASRLRMGGVAYFQIPTYQRDYYFDPEQYLRLRAGSDGIEMHMLPQTEVFRIFLKHGCMPLEIYEDELSGSRATQRSNTFVFRKVAEGGSPQSLSLAESEQWSSAAIQRDLRDELEKVKASRALAESEQRSSAAIQRDLRDELEKVKASRAEVTDYARSLKADCESLQVELGRIRHRFRWVRFLLPSDPNATDKD